MAPTVATLLRRRALFLHANRQVHKDGRQCVARQQPPRANAAGYRRCRAPSSQRRNVTVQVAQKVQAALASPDAERRRQRRPYLGRTAHGPGFGANNASIMHRRLTRLYKFVGDSMNPQEDRIVRSSRPTWRWLLTVANLLIFLFWLNPAAAAEKQFCLDDNDLQLVLIANFLQSSGAIAGTCARQFPELETMAREVANQFQKTYAIVTEANAHAVTKILLDHGLSEQDQKELHDSWTAAGIYEANNYSPQQCRSSIMGFKGMAVAENFNVVEALALLNFDVRRQKVARCSSK